MYSVLPARIACEYGPIAAGASGEWITCLAMAFSVRECEFSSGGRVVGAVAAMRVSEAAVAWPGAATAI
jgi:hypothetical protein